MLFALKPVWNSARCKADLVLFSFDKLREAVSEQKSIAFVFPHEGRFDVHGNWKFNYEYSNLCPILIPLEQAFLINQFLAFKGRVEINMVEKEILSDHENGRQFFLNLCKLVCTPSRYTGIGEDESNPSGGSTVPSPQPGPQGGSPTPALA